jgi:putative transposase
MMSRLTRIAVVNVPHHVTQRGNARQFILANDDERAVYWSLLRKYLELYELSLLGYCLMSNHVHRAALCGTQPAAGGLGLPGGIVAVV